ncbi:YjgB family protein [Shimazuella sp. AN120528]|uniref:DUF4309 domain-containing protein n=1 Tax=Shimazuella soli TaxID=1892854 RepID=UPI001F0D45B2|nr:DUF4309 domain-containing protein [Shimazuella soli]MCH5585164.1 YjgB family protein [Shimazuella soli]
MNKKDFGKGILVATLAVGTLFGGLIATQPSYAANNIHAAQAHNEQNHAKLLKQTMQLANKGKVISSGEFGIYSSQKSIESKWGKPDSDSNRAEGEMKYNKHATLFYVGDDVTDHGGETVVYQLQTTDKRYASVTYKEIQKTLGKGYVYKDKNGGFVSYEVADAKSLTFYFNVDKKGNFTKIKYVEITLP